MTQNSKQSQNNKKKSVTFTIMIPISDFQEVIFLDLETLPKLVLTILVPLQILQDQL